MQKQARFLVDVSGHFPSCLHVALSVRKREYEEPTLPAIVMTGSCGPNAAA